METNKEAVIDFSGQEIMLIKSGVEAPNNRSGFGEIFEAVK